MPRISDSKLRSKKLKPKVQPLSRAVGRRRRANPDLYDNYSSLLKLYVIAKSEAAQKKQVRSEAGSKLKKPPLEVTVSKLKAVSASIRLLVLRSKSVASRVSSAIEISYQSIHK